MSTSGYFDGAKSSYGWYARLEYSYTQTTTTNITLTLKVYNATKPTYNNNANSAYYVIAGDKIYKTYSWTSIGWNTLGSKTVSVSANATSYNASAQWVSDVNSTYTPSSLSVSGTIEFPKINLLTVSAPSNVTVEEGETATFSVIASGGSSYIYQWYFGGSAVSNSNSSTYSKVATLSDNGKQVYCKVTSGSNSVTSSSATLYVKKKNVPELHVTSIPNYYVGYPGGAYDPTFKVTVRGGTSYTYNWYVVTLSGTKTKFGSMASAGYTLNEYDDQSYIYCQVIDRSGATIETNKCLLRVGKYVSQNQLPGRTNIILPKVKNTNVIPMIYDGTSWNLATWMIYPADANDPATVDYAIANNAKVK